MTTTRNSKRGADIRLKGSPTRVETTEPVTYTTKCNTRFGGKPHHWILPPMEAGNQKPGYCKHCNAKYPVKRILAALPPATGPVSPVLPKRESLEMWMDRFDMVTM